MNSKLVLALVCLCVLGNPCRAQAPQPAPLPPDTGTAADAPDRNEPNVKHTVIEDEGSKIDELRVRGQVQHVIVTPKVGTHKSYEIIMNRSGRPTDDGTGGATGAAGKRVWSVMSF
jgi:hypothetical protein